MKELFQLPHQFEMNIETLRRHAKENSTTTTDMSDWLREHTTGKYGIISGTGMKMYLMSPGSDEPLAKVDEYSPVMLYLFFEELSDALQFKLIWG